MGKEEKTDWVINPTNIIKALELLDIALEEIENDLQNQLENHGK